MNFPTIKIADVDQGGIESHRWRNFSQAVRAERGSKCERCSLRESPGQYLLCHRIIAQGDKYDRSNIRVLCRGCVKKEQIGHTVDPDTLPWGGLFSL